MRKCNHTGLSKLLRVFLLALCVLGVTGQSFTYSGTALFSLTKAPVYPGTVSLRSTLNQLVIASVDLQPNGAFSVIAAMGEYSVEVAFSTIYFSSDSNLLFVIELDQDLTKQTVLVPVSILAGLISDADTQQPLPHCTLTARAETDFGFDTLQVQSDLSGSFVVYLVANVYENVTVATPMELQTNYSSSYGFGSQFWTSTQNDQQFLLTQGATLTGKVYFASDNTSVPNANVYAVANEGAAIVSQTDSQGIYSMFVPGNQNIQLGVSFTSTGPGENSEYVCGGIEVASVVPSAGSVTSFDLLIPDFIFLANVTDVSQTPVPYGVLAAKATRFYGPRVISNRISATSDSQGEIQVRICEDFFQQILIDPPVSSEYILTSYPAQNWFAGMDPVDFVIQSQILVEGVVYFSDGSYLPSGAELHVNISECCYDKGLSVRIGKQGEYEITLAANEFVFNAAYTWYDEQNSDVFFHCSGVELGHYIVSEEVHVFQSVVNKDWCSGTITNSTGFPVAGVTLQGRAYSYVDYGSVFDYFQAISDEFGHFYVELLSNFYMQLLLIPPAGSLYFVTPLPDSSLGGSMVHFVIL